MPALRTIKEEKVDDLGARWLHWCYAQAVLGDSSYESEAFDNLSDKTKELYRNVVAIATANPLEQWKKNLNKPVRARKVL